LAGASFESFSDLDYIGPTDDLTLLAEMLELVLYPVSEDFARRKLQSFGLEINWGQLDKYPDNSRQFLSRWLAIP